MSQTPDQIVAWAEQQTAPAPCKPAYRRLTDADRSYILALSKQNLTQAQIAERVGCTQQAVSLWLSQVKDTTADASLYLRGQALRMARNVVKRGQARDHIQALRGINVLEAEQGQGVSVHINGFVLAGLKPGAAQDVVEGELLSPPKINNLAEENQG